MRREPRFRQEIHVSIEKAMNGVGATMLPAGPARPGRVLQGECPLSGVMQFPTSPRSRLGSGGRIVRRGPIRRMRDAPDRASFAQVF